MIVHSFPSPKKLKCLRVMKEKWFIVLFNSLPHASALKPATTSILCTRCTINKRVCDVIIHSGSIDSILSRLLVQDLQLYIRSGKLRKVWRLKLLMCVWFCSLFVKTIKIRPVVMLLTWMLALSS